MRYLEHCQIVTLTLLVARQARARLRLDSPDDGGQEELVVVLQRGEHWLPQQEVGEDPPGEDDQHGRDPECEGMFP